MGKQISVHDVTYDLLRRLGLTAVLGNPGSTEQTFLMDFPEDFTYVQALQEESVVAMADAYAQVTGRPAIANVHTAAGTGTGNAMGSLIAAYDAKTPLILTAGQQHRDMVVGEPYLANTDATTLPKPWVKWAYEPPAPMMYRPPSCVPTRPRFSRPSVRYSCPSPSTTGPNPRSDRLESGRSVAASRPRRSGWRSSRGGSTRACAPPSCSARRSTAAAGGIRPSRWPRSSRHRCTARRRSEDNGVRGKTHLSACSSAGAFAPNLQQPCT